MAAFVPFVPPVAPPILFMYPLTTYGISYDIYTNANQHAPPNGWGAARGEWFRKRALRIKIAHIGLTVARIYKRLETRLNLAGFARDQYSDFIQHATSAQFTYNTMVQLEHLPPAYKVSSTLRRVRMNQIDLFMMMDVTGALRLGGAFNRVLRAPVPSNLVPGGLAVPPVAVPAAGFIAPTDSTHPAASVAANFLT